MKKTNKLKDGVGTNLTCNMSHFSGFFFGIFWTKSKTWKLQVQMGAMPGYQVAAGPSQAEAWVDDTPVAPPWAAMNIQVEVIQQMNLK